MNSDNWVYYYVILTFFLALTVGESMREGVASTVIGIGAALAVMYWLARDRG